MAILNVRAQALRRTTPAKVQQGLGYVPTRVKSGSQGSSTGSGGIIVVGPPGNQTITFAGFSYDLTTSEALAAGAIVNVWNSSGAKARNANATDDTKKGHGFVLAAFGSAALATVFFPGPLLTGLSGLTPGVEYFLSTTNGLLTATAPSTTGNVDQIMGFAVDTDKLVVVNRPTLGL